MIEVNFDGIVGPTHNYAGLSLGNLAATRHKGQVSRPREAALQGIAKMRLCLSLGLTQGILLPHPRPDRAWLASLATGIEAADPGLRANAMSASAMWAANAATVSPALDTGDGRCHISVANLTTMAHRSHEWPATLAQLRVAFADERRFKVHPPVPPPFGDEGAANHMRLYDAHDATGVEVFVFGVSGGAFPARQHVEASRAIARRHGLANDKTLFVEQSGAAIAAGAFHNDVVAVADRNILFAHEQAFEDRDAFYAALRAALPSVVIIEVPADRVSLADAVGSYLFNAQLISLPDGAQCLILPAEARETPAVWQWLQELVRGNGPIRRLEVVDLRQSMANGGGPACLRLRVVADPAAIDPRFLVDEARLDRIADVIDAHWPDAIAPEQLADPALWARAEAGRKALLHALDLGALV